MPAPVIMFVLKNPFLVTSSTGLEKNLRGEWGSVKPAFISFMYVACNCEKQHVIFVWFYPLVQDMKHKKIRKNKSFFISKLNKL